MPSIWTILRAALALILPVAPLMLGRTWAEGPSKPPQEERRTDRYGDPLPEGAISRLGTIRLKHAHLYTVVFSRDGRSVFAGDHDRPQDGGSWIRVWNATTGELRRSFAGHEYGADDLALSPDGKTLAGIGGGASIWLWDVTTGRCVHKLPGYGEGNLLAIAFHPDGNTLASIGGGSKIGLYDVRTGKLRKQFGEKEGGQCLAFSPDGKVLAAGGGEALHLWDAHKGRKLWQVDAKAGGFNALSFSPDGKMLAAGRDDGMICLFAPDTGKLVRQWRAHKEVLRASIRRQAVHSLAFSPEGKLLASGGDDAILRLWEPVAGTQVRELRGHEDSIYSVAFAPDGKVLASGGPDNRIRLWNVDGGREQPAFGGHEDIVTCVAFAPDGRTLASGGFDNTVRLWNISQAEERKRFRGQDPITGVVFSPDGKLLAATSCKGIIYVRDSISGKLLRSIEAHEGYIGALVFSPDGRALATAGSDLALRVWDPSTGRQRLRISRKGVVGWGTYAAFSPDGNVLAFGGDENAIHLWDWRKERELRRFVGDSRKVFAIAFSPDGETLASAGTDRSIRFWRVASGKEVRRWADLDSEVKSMTFSPNGKFLAWSGRHNRSVQLWEVATGQEAHCFRGHQDETSQVAFAPDCRRLASASRDFTVLIWDLVDPWRGASGADAPAAMDLEESWRRLADASARHAFRAIKELARTPKQTVGLLRQRVRPVPDVTPRQIDEWIAGLDSEEFAVRGRSAKRLEELAEAAGPSLRKLLRGRPTLEVRRRAEILLGKLDAAVPPTWYLRALRAVIVLEEIGNPEAQQALAELAKGSPESRLTREAKASLQRLTSRANRQP